MRRKHVAKLYSVLLLFIFTAAAAGAGRVHAQEQDRDGSGRILAAEGDAAFRVRLYSDALERYDAAVAGDAALRNDQIVTMKRAMCRYHLGDYTEALRLLTVSKSLGGWFHDYIDYYRALSSLHVAGAEEAAGIFSAIPSAYPSSVITNEARYYAGYLYSLLGRYEESIRTLLPLENARVLQAGNTSVRFLTGTAFLRSGDEEEGVSRLVKIMRTAPSDTLALKSAFLIDELRTRSGTPLTEEEAVLSAAVFTRHAVGDRALRSRSRRLIDEYFSRFPEGKYVGRAYFERGKIKFAERRYLDAISDFTEAFSRLREPRLIRDSRLYIARSYQNHGDKASADREYRRYAREYPFDPKAAESLFAIAYNFERNGEYLEASQAYRYAAMKAEPNNYRDRALFRAGFCLYKDNYITKSIQYFHELRDRYAGSALALRAAFWEAVALERLGKTAESRRIYSWLAERRERDYYVAAAREKTGRDVSFAPDSAFTAVPATPGNLQRIAVAGLIFGEPWGTREIRRYRLNHRMTRNTLEALYHVLVEMGTYREAVRVADLLYTRYHAGSSNTRALQAVYPRHYRELLRRISDGRRVDENLVFSIMRRESLFGLDARSNAGAMGLMQLMPSTAETLAGRLGLHDFSVGDAYKPDINIMLGVRNIRELLQRFRGEKELAIAAYNAGDEAVRRWMRRFGTDNIDEFIENIEYSETRTFVKEVLKNYYYYTHLYHDSLPRQ